jgi:hypothetical protein
LIHPKCTVPHCGKGFRDLRSVAEASAHHSGAVIRRIYFLSACSNGASSNALLLWAENL